MERARWQEGKLPWMAGLLPFFLAIFVHVVRPSQPLAIESAPRPALAFDQYLVDLGRVAPTSELRAVFAFRNRGRAPVDITDISPSCGCLVPHVSSRRIAPGERGQIVLRMLPANESPGTKELFTDITYNDGEPRDVRLTFRLELPDQQLSVRPRALLVYQSSREPVTQKIHVTDTRSQPARILDATVKPAICSVSPGESRRLEPEGLEHVLEVTVPGEIPPGRHEAVVTIRTDDPLSPTLRVPVVIQANAAIP